ncbi:hypothetical protein QBK95_16205 [Aquimarina sp. 2201CG14-23]|nr:hypothetical protein [Aquimarina sp. 2201CG14-23]
MIGYHTWYTKDIVVSAVLEEGGLSLVVSNIKEKTNNTIQKKIGRSLHKIPNSQLISYISKENEVWEIKSLNPKTGETRRIKEVIPESEDICWLINGDILMAKGNTIYKFNPKTDNDWSIFHTFKNPELDNITRMSSNNISTLFTLVASKSHK